MFFNSIKEINRLRKWINRLLSKGGMSNIYLKVTTEKNWLHISQNPLWLFYYFNFERKCGVLKSKSPGILLNKNINFNKNETESKMENLLHSFRETNLLLHLIQESQIKSKTFISFLNFDKHFFLYRLFCP